MRSGPHLPKQGRGSSPNEPLPLAFFLQSGALCEEGAAQLLDVDVADVL